MSIFGLVSSIEYEDLPTGIMLSSSAENLDSTLVAEICFCVQLNTSLPSVQNNCIEGYTVLFCAQQSGTVPVAGQDYVFKNTMVMGLVALGFKVEQNKNKKSEWRICVTYGQLDGPADDEGNEDSDPEDPTTYPCEIGFEYVEREAVSDCHRLKGYFLADGTDVSFAVVGDIPQFTPYPVPSVAGPGTAYTGRIVNAAGCPIERTTTEYRERISVTTYVRQLPCPTTVSGGGGTVATTNPRWFLNHRNNAPVIIFQTDKNGFNYLCQFDTGTLKIAAVSKTDLVINGCRFFCLQLTFEYDENKHCIRELNQGTQARFDVGLPDGNGDLINSGPLLDRCQTGKRNVKTCDGNPTNGAVPLNQYGTELGPGEDPVYMHWEDCFDTIDFGVFNICGTQPIVVPVDP